MTKPPAYQHYAQDWLVGTMHLDLEQQGAYLRLLDHEWVDGPLSTDVGHLAKLVGLPTQDFQSRVWPALKDHFCEKNGGFVNRRMERERRKQAAFRKQQSAKGMRSGQMRREQRSNRGSTEHEPDGNLSSSSSSSSSSSPATALTGQAIVARRETAALLSVQSSPVPEKLNGNGAHLVDRVAVAARREASSRKVQTAALKHAAEIVFTYWRDSMGFNPKTALFGGKRETRLIARLRENRGNVSELLYVVDGALKDDWIMGRAKDSTKPYNDTQTVFRDREQVEKLAALGGYDGETQHPYLAEDDDVSLTAAGGSGIIEPEDS